VTVQGLWRVTGSPQFLSSLRHQFEHWLFDVPDSFGVSALRWMLVPLRLAYALVRDILRGALGLHAMGLVYSTLFAIVPLIAVAFAVLQAFGFHRGLEPVLYEFLRPLGEQGHALADSIMGFVENVKGSVLGTVGFVVLLFTVFSLIQSVEQALNFVWHVQRSRSFARRASEYLIVALVVPVVAVLAMAMLARLEASDVMARLSGLPPDEQPHFAPYLLVIGLFLFVYVYMPNTRVRFGAASIGALFGGVVWAATGALFARLVVYASQTAIIYAGFAVVLLFLVWLYLSWLILLLGAQLSFYVQHPEHVRTGHADIPMTGALTERLALSVMHLVGERFLDGGPRWTISDLAERLEVPGTVLDDIVSALQAHGLVIDAEDDTVVPARALEAIRLDAILDAVRHETPDPRRPVPRAVPAADEAARQADTALQESVGAMSLRDLIRPADPGERPTRGRAAP
jgi:membrane protein